MSGYLNADPDSDDWFEALCFIGVAGFVVWAIVKWA